MHMHGTSLQSQKAKNAGDPGSTPGWEKSPEEGNVTPRHLHHLEHRLCLLQTLEREEPMASPDRPGMPGDHSEWRLPRAC